MGRLEGPAGRPYSEILEFCFVGVWAILEGPIGRAAWKALVEGPILRF